MLLSISTIDRQDPAGKILGYKDTVWTSANLFKYKTRKVTSNRDKKREIQFTYLLALKQTRPIHAEDWLSL